MPGSMPQAVKEEKSVEFRGMPIIPPDSLKVRAGQAAAKADTAASSSLESRIDRRISEKVDFGALLQTVLFYPEILNNPKPTTDAVKNFLETKKATKEGLTAFEQTTLNRIKAAENAKSTFDAPNDAIQAVIDFGTKKEYSAIAAELVEQANPRPYAKAEWEMIGEKLRLNTNGGIIGYNSQFNFSDNVTEDDVTTLAVFDVRYSWLWRRTLPEGKTLEDVVREDSHGLEKLPAPQKQDMAKEDEIPFANALVKEVRRIVDDVEKQVQSEYGIKEPIITEQDKTVISAVALKYLSSNDLFNVLSLSKEGGEYKVSIDVNTLNTIKEPVEKELDHIGYPNRTIKKKFEEDFQSH